MSLRLLFLLACACFLVLVNSNAYAQPEIEMTEVVFEEVEPGIEPYISRLLLSEHFLRLDDGIDSGDFILFERKTGQIHSFNHEDKTHLAIKPLEAPDIDFKLDFKIHKNNLHSAPKINGVTPVEYQFYADSKKCKQSVNVAGILPQMTKVMIDYEQALVGQAKATLQRIPSSMRTACYMANNFLYASEYIKVGFPLHVADYEGRQKRLVSFQEIKKPETIVQFPAGYQLYYPDNIVTEE